MVALLICTDLDRTLLPNGPQTESDGAQKVFARLVTRQNVCLAYVSGRHLSLIEDAIEKYNLPRPDHIIADVGSTIYNANKTPWNAWWEYIGSDWHGLNRKDFIELLSDIDILELQEAEKQTQFKLSYYVPADADVKALQDKIQYRLNTANVSVSLIWSVDETSHTGLLDLLPPKANKLQAIRFLMIKNGFGVTQTVFSGDSGNDLPVLASEIPATLVANATEEVRYEAQRMAKANNHPLYCAIGMAGMNGNYAAGIIEGIVHYHPYVQDWLKH